MGIESVPSNGNPVLLAEQCLSFAGRYDVVTASLSLQCGTSIACKAILQTS